ncbi:MAG TPA: zinc-dependent metalloprotease [Bryobacteraceae bacterium]|nr:zinc-dependent metalloprotease [Bryobacteraceae bacterium]
MKRIIPAVLLIACTATILSAQEPPTPADAPQTPPAGGPPRPGGAAPSADPQPYDKVITKEAKSKKGIFTVHQVKDKYYYEIPKSEYGKQFLLVSQIAKTTLGVGYGGQELGSRVVYWELSGNKVHLRDVNYSVVADPKTPIAQAVGAANNNSIIMTFPVAAFGADKNSAVIEVTRLFSTDVFELSARQRLNATTMDASRSNIDRISPYPENIEVEATHTYTKAATPPGATAAPVNPFIGAGMRPGSATVVLHHSMVKLPENPMVPRLYDDRVGYFTVSQMDYGRDEQRAPRRRYITRWRLEKKDPNAAMSEPVKPIVYWIDSATPTKWVPWMKKAIEDWQVAFEAAGFKNAIIAKVAPTPEQDPDFSPEDIRHSVVRWLPSTVENASGPHISDPRTGEILNADIQFYHNVMNLQRDWYFLQVGPLDPRAQKLPLPDDLMGRLLEFVLAHEVGHTLGFQHNMKASSMYPQEKVRDAEWVKKMGHAPSIMDYSRFNYVAQPEDNIPVENLVPGIGPYDIWATAWGYKPVPGRATPDDEKHTLDEWARQQDTTPWFRFSTNGSGGSDPGELTEAVGDADALKSTAMGIKNLQRVAKMLMPATTTKQGEPYEDLAELYGRMLGQWVLELNHVAAIVGGFNSQEKYIGQEGVVYSPVPRPRQAEAVKFLNENAFATPMWAVDPQILRRIEPIGELSRVRNAQNNVLNNLLSSARFARLVEQDALDGSASYAPAEFLADVRKGVWSELDAPKVRIDAFRRNLQRAYLDLVNSKLNSNASAIPAGLPVGFPIAFFASSGDEKPLYRAELKALNTAIGAALVKAPDKATKAHLEGARDQIAKILDPKFAPPSGAAGNVIRIGFGDQLDPFLTPPDQLGTCWPDYVIRP